MATAWSRVSRKPRFDWSTACYVTSVKRWWSDWSKRTRMSVPTIHTLRSSLFFTLSLSLSISLFHFFLFFLFFSFLSLFADLPFPTGFPTSITLIHSPKRRHSSRQSFFYWEKCASSSLPIPADKDTRQIGFTTATIPDSFILPPLRSRVKCDKTLRSISMDHPFSRGLSNRTNSYIKNLLHGDLCGKKWIIKEEVKNREKSRNHRR